MDKGQALPFAAVILNPTRASWRSSSAGRRRRLSGPPTSREGGRQWEEKREGGGAGGEERMHAWVVHARAAERQVLLCELEHAPLAPLHAGTIRRPTARCWPCLALPCTRAWQASGRRRVPGRMVGSEMHDPNAPMRTQSHLLKPVANQLALLCAALARSQAGAEQRVPFGRGRPGRCRFRCGAQPGRRRGHVHVVCCAEASECAPGKRGAGHRVRRRGGACLQGARGLGCPAAAAGLAAAGLACGAVLQCICVLRYLPVAVGALLTQSWLSCLTLPVAPRCLRPPPWARPSSLRPTTGW